MPFIPQKRLYLFPGNVRIFEENSFTDRCTQPVLILYWPFMCLDLSVLFSCLKPAGSVHLPLLLNTRNKNHFLPKLWFYDPDYFECSYLRSSLEVVVSVHCKTCTHAKITICNAPFKERRKLKQFEKKMIKIGLLHLSFSGTLYPSYRQTL